MADKKLSSVFGKTAIAIPSPDSSWPLPEQFLGIEIEIENFNNNQLSQLSRAPGAFWEVKEDGSLRNGREAVFSQPLMGSQLTTAIRQFFSIVTEYTTSRRTSIHVHMNMRQDDDTMDSLRNLVVLYYMYENSFFWFSDESRKWCSYCCSFEDEPPAPVVAILRNDSADVVLNEMANTNSNTNRYYGLNLYALMRYGTVEFRHFPCVKEEARLIDWLHFLMELKAAGIRMAREGTSPFTLFNSTSDMAKLLEYMPKYGPMMRRIVTDEQAFHKLTLAAAYRCGGLQGDEGLVTSTNIFFTRYAEKQQAGAKVNTGTLAEARALMDELAQKYRQAPTEAAKLEIHREYEAVSRRVQRLTDEENIKAHRAKGTSAKKTTRTPRMAVPGDTRGERLQAQANAFNPAVWQNLEREVPTAIARMAPDAVPTDRVRQVTDEELLVWRTPTDASAARRDNGLTAAQWGLAITETRDDLTARQIRLRFMRQLTSVHYGAALRQGGFTTDTWARLSAADRNELALRVLLDQVAADSAPTTASNF